MIIDPQKKKEIINVLGAERKGRIYVSECPKCKVKSSFIVSFKHGLSHCYECGFAEYVEQLLEAINDL